MENLVIGGMAFTTALYHTLIIALSVTIALSLLMFLSKEGKFYPAMPFLSLGCFVGYGAVWLINFL